MDKTTCIKVVVPLGTAQFRSMLPSPVCLKYKVGKTTIPACGPIFCYSMDDVGKKYAYSWIFDGKMIALECEFNPWIKPVEYIINTLDFPTKEQYIRFWMGEVSIIPRIDRIKLMTLDCVLLATRVKPIRIMRKEEFTNGNRSVQ